ncbi:MAG TPA: hypothetical protein VKA50_06630 [Gammaproteobacteria bacterium]|nr:hypothetical protein [Gammaproteobacteria bacterium]
MDQKTHDSNDQTAQHGPQGLTAEQWQGLARLADLAGAVDTALRGPLGAPAAELAQTAGEVYAEHDLPALAREVIETIAAWREAGLLQTLRDNARPIAETLALLAPLTGELIAQLRDLPLDKLRDELGEWQTLYAKLKAARAFFDDEVADALTGQLVEAGRFWQENDLEATLTDLLRTVARLHESGMLARIRELADYLDASAQDLDRPALVTDLVKAADKTQLHRMGQFMEGLDQAMEDAGRDEGHLGGTGGLLHLLRDKQIQKGLRTLFILPVYLEQIQRH